MDLNVFAGALQAVQGNVERLRKADQERQMLQVELMRSAPPGFAPSQKQGLFGPEYGLEYVGLKDPRIQASLAEEQQKMEMEQRGRLAAEAALSPILMAREKERLQAEAGVQRETQSREMAMRGLMQASESLGELTAGARAAMSPDELAKALAGPRGALGFAQAVAPDVAANWSKAQAPDLLRQLSQGPQAAPQVQLPFGPPISVPLGQPNQPAPGGQNEQKAAPSGGQPQAPTISGPADVYPFVESAIKAGRPEAEVRADAIRQLEAHEAPRRGLARQGVAAMPQEQVVRLVDDAFQQARDTEKAAAAKIHAGLEEKGLKRLQGQEDLKDMAPALAQEGGPLASVPAKNPPKDDPEARDIVVNEIAVPQAATGDAAPIRQLRQEAGRHGLDPKRLADSLGSTDWPRHAEATLRGLGAQVGPKSSGLPGVLVVNAGRVDMDESGRVRIRRSTKAAQASVVGKLSGAKPLDEPGLTPEGLAENVWLAGLPEGSRFAGARYAAVMADQLSPDVRALAERYNAVVQQRAEAEIGHKLPLGTARGNVLLLDLAAIRGEQ